MAVDREKLVEGVAIHMIADAQHSAEDGKVVRVIDHPKFGTVVEYRPAKMESTTHFAHLDRVRLIPKKRRVIYKPAPSVIGSKRTKGAS